MEYTKRPIAIVLGYKLEPDGSLHPYLKKRLDKAKDWLASNPSGLILITGGVTREGYVSEAKVSLAYLEEKGVSREAVLLEQEALATADHPALVKRVLREAGVLVGAVIIITGDYHLARSKRIFERQWHDLGPVTWVPISGSKWTDWIKEGILNLIFTLDPESTYIMPWLKKIFRNG